MSQLPYFLSDFSSFFAPICREIVMLSFEIMVILDWTSPISLSVSKIILMMWDLSERRSEEVKKFSVDAQCSM